MTQFKLSGTYPLPYKFRLSGLFQSLPGTQSARDGGNVGKDISETYSVGRAIAPGLTQTTVNVRLNEPGIGLPGPREPGGFRRFTRFQGWEGCGSARRWTSSTR